ncbi:hypothetical protein ES332_A09G096100v1 [Gossypium tomentosum]|uniref:X8 domain-containing protein n=1 Tax=Gossypium tomentosum TaxID=34277 RepID=A0A5D2P129_GOSTO|nr:hypothetical protein ES332_A09G096100v1 [Gossypium tomentosum]
MQDMGCRLLQFLPIFLFHIFFCSGSSVSGKPPPQGINQKPKQSIRMLFAPSISTTILDDVPIVNPTTPGTTPNPTSPSTEPITNPTTPTSPDTNPTPTLPDTNPAPTGPTTTPPTGPTMTPPTGTTTTPPTGTTTTPPTGTTTTPPTGTTTTPPTGTTTSPGTSGGSWCVANQGASPTALQVALDYACGYGGADCSTIQTGGSCYEPNTIQNHASYAFNDYYQKHPDPTSCVFGGAAQLSNTDPSTGNCHFPASSSTGGSPPSNTTPPTTMSPPSTTTMAPPFGMTPPTFTGTGGDTGFEPTGLPNSAISVSFRFWPIVATISLVWSFITANKL